MLTDDHDHAGAEAPSAAAADAAGDTLDGLTEAQRRAVLATEGPVLVLAGPGSGKTRVITRRIAHLIRSGIPPWQILALTFTNKAAAEMRQRVTALLGEGRATRGLTVTTFHSLCARLLRRFADVAELPGLKADFAIYDRSDQTALMKRVLGELDLKSSNFPPRAVLTRISDAKNKLLDAAGFQRQAGDFYARTVARVYDEYEKALRKANAVDFDDLLLLTVKMLERSDEVREACLSRWQYLLIDEYQDTNRAQFILASLLAGSGAKDFAGEPRANNICVVGDPDQSIYGWRGADISNILEFEKHYPDAVTIPLGENFRSTNQIIETADTLIRNNKKRKHKDLSAVKGDGPPVEITLCRDEHHEAALVADWLKRIHEEGPAAAGAPSPQHPVLSTPWKDMAVFYRMNALSRVIEEELRNRGVPYIIARGTAFYEREEVKNALAYLRVVANRADDVSLGRIVNVPTRGIGAASLRQLESASLQAGIPLFDALRRAAEVEGVSSRAAASVQRFVEMVDGWTGAGSFLGADVPASLSDLVERVIRDSGLEQMYRDLAAKTGTESDEERLDNLNELVSSAADFENEYDPANDPANEPIMERRLPPGSDVQPRGGSAMASQDAGEGRALYMPPLLAMLRAYLERVALVADADTVDPSQGAVTLMTLHAAKGLEFPAAAMIGMEEGSLPHFRAEMSEDELEEERRLCFVGITRAMRRLHLSCARYRTIRGVSERTIPSRFLSELPAQHVRGSDQADPLAWENGWDDGHRDEFGDRQRTRSRQTESRAQASGSRGSAAPGGAAPRAVGGIHPGARVRHPQFGLGEVVTVTGGASARAKVKFRDVGLKTLVLEYARLQVL
jgi:DNA helicase-2/ATP-dependent DNA helicase PcrA